MAKVALRLGCTKQSKNLERHLFNNQPVINKNITYGIGTEGGAGDLARSPVVDYQVAQRIQPETLEAQSTAQSQPKKYISNIKKSQMKYF